MSKYSNVAVELMYLWHECCFCLLQLVCFFRIDFMHCSNCYFCCLSACVFSTHIRYFRMVIMSQRLFSLGHIAYLSWIILGLGTYNPTCFLYSDFNFKVFWSLGATIVVITIATVIIIWLRLFNKGKFKTHFFAQFFFYKSKKFDSGRTTSIIVKREFIISAYRQK